MARRKRKDNSTEIGIKLVLAGMAMLLAPAAVTLMQPVSAIVDGVAHTLRTPGWITLAAGGCILMLHVLEQRKSRAARKQTAAPAAKHLKRRRPKREQPDTNGGQVENIRAKMDESRGKQPPVGDTETAAPVPDLPTAWSPRVFELIEWRRFETVCETLFRQAGFETRSHSYGADGGVDIWLHSSHAPKPVAVVQCKHWKNRPVPVEQVRAFLGVMAAHGLKRGTFATSSTFTADALAFGRANGINLQDGDGLLALIKSRSESQQTELLGVALQGDFWRPTCPSCGVKLVARKARKSSGRFWGCKHFPDCRYRLPMTATEAALSAQERATST